MIKVDAVVQLMAQAAPKELAESWDNVGLLVGRRQQAISKLMTCLTVTPDVVQEAIDGGVQLILSHHPLPFKSLKKITDDTYEGRLLLALIEAGIALYSPHTSYDSAQDGINQQIAERLQLQDIAPMRPDETLEQGVGRMGKVERPGSLSNYLEFVKNTFMIKQVQYISASAAPIRKVGIACGAAGQLLGLAKMQGCDLFITGETNFHTLLLAKGENLSLILLGHYISERFAVETLAAKLAQKLPSVEVFASHRETDPVEFG